MMYLPEGMLIDTSENKAALSSPAAIEKAYLRGDILEAYALRCDAEHNLHVGLGEVTGIIGRRDAAAGMDGSDARDIAVISRVGKPVCFMITDISGLYQHPPRVGLSRRIVQQRAIEHLLGSLTPGEVVRAAVTHLEPFGAFVDIGCGFTSMISIENISVSRILHPRDRFYTGQRIYAVVRGVDRENQRIILSHKELLGTWEQNAGRFSPGETVTGIVRGIESYGVFIELMPNLSGLAEKRQGMAVGQRASVYIKSILPERMKVKLSVIDLLPPSPEPPVTEYFIKAGRIARWQYSPEGCEAKDIHTEFSTQS